MCNTHGPPWKLLSHTIAGTHLCLGQVSFREEWGRFTSSYLLRKNGEMDDDGKLDKNLHMLNSLRHLRNREQYSCHQLTSIS